MTRIFKIAKNNIPSKHLINIGEKGSGKTALQNVWLHDNNKKLEDSKIIWVRCDCYKLYNLWRGVCDEENFDGSIKLDPTNLINLNEYLDIQLLYVFSKYCFKSDSFFSKIC